MKACLPLLLLLACTAEAPPRQAPPAVHYYSIGPD
jgi:hypothetical protein